MRAVPVAATLAAALAACGLPAAAAATGPAPARVQVTAKEFWLGLSRRTLPTGPAVVELVNFGEDPHDLRLRRVGGTRTYSVPIVLPGGYRDLELRLLPGRYVLWCSLGDHAARGMKTSLTVRGG